MLNSAFLETPLEIDQTLARTLVRCGAAHYHRALGLSD